MLDYVMPLGCSVVVESNAVFEGVWVGLSLAYQRAKNTTTRSELHSSTSQHLLYSIQITNTTHNLQPLEIKQETDSPQGNLQSQ